MSRRVAIVLLAAGSLLPNGCGTPERRPLTTYQAAKNLTALIVESSHWGTWPRFGGRNFVLSVVADGDIDTRNPGSLWIFFGTGGVPPGIGREDYREVTKESLAAGRFPRLTAFAGRRNDEASYRLPDGEHPSDGPILAAEIPEGVVIGFADGVTRWMEREDLGLAPEEPIRFGDASPSPLLRKLSDR